MSVQSRWSGAVKFTGAHLLLARYCLIFCHLIRFRGTWSVRYSLIVGPDSVKSITGLLISLVKLITAGLLRMKDNFHLLMKCSTKVQVKIWENSPDPRGSPL
jgi:hypothetical protein